MSIQRGCEKISSKIATELHMNEEQKAIIRYGIFAMIQTTIAIFTNILFGTLLGVLIPSLIISFIAVILRKYSGGAHAQTPESCVIIGTLVSVGGALAVSYISWNMELIILLGIILFAIAYYTICKLAPVDSAAKPIRKEEKKKMLKKRSIFILMIYYIIILISLLFHLNNGYKGLLLYIACIYVGIGWQVFTLTHMGHLVMRKIDLFLNKIMKQLKGGKFNEKA